MSVNVTPTKYISLQRPPCSVCYKVLQHRSQNQSVNFHLDNLHRFSNHCRDHFDNTRFKNHVRDVMEHTKNLPVSYVFIHNADTPARKLT